MKRKFIFLIIFISNFFLSQNKIIISDINTKTIYSKCDSIKIKQIKIEKTLAYEKCKKEYKNCLIHNESNPYPIFIGGYENFRIYISEKLKNRKKFPSQKFQVILKIGKNDNIDSFSFVNLENSFLKKQMIKILSSKKLEKKWFSAYEWGEKLESFIYFEVIVNN